MVQARAVRTVRANPRTQAAMVRNLTTLGNALTTEEVAAGVGWYPLASRTARRLSYRYGTTYHRAAGVIAATSPRQTWAGNITLAERTLAEGNPQGLPASRRWVASIFAGRRPTSVFPHKATSQKVYWFYRAITGDQNAVVLDRWAFRAAIGLHSATEADIKSLERVGIYDMTAEAYRKVAPMFNLSPREFQAAIWVHVRGEST